MGGQIEIVLKTKAKYLKNNTIQHFFFSEYSTTKSIFFPNEKHCILTIQSLNPLSKTKIEHYTLHHFLK